MARLETDIVLESSSGENMVGRSTPYINILEFPINNKLKDDVFFATSTQSYSRKEMTIYQFTHGLTRQMTPDYVSNTIHCIKDCSRFVPMVYPWTDSESIQSNLNVATSELRFDEYVPYSSGYSYDNISINDIKTRNYHGYSRTGMGDYENTISFITRFDYKKWAVCPVLVGIYGNTSVNSGNTPGILMANTIAVSDYFIDPSTYPTTQDGFNLLGFSLCFYFAGNFGDNSQGYGRLMFEDCGFEFDHPDNIQTLGACYAEFNGGLQYSNNVIINYESAGLYSFMGKQTLLGLCPQIQSPFASNYRNLQGGTYGTPVQQVVMTSSRPSFTDSTRILQFGVMGNGEHFDWTQDTYHLGSSYSASGSIPTSSVSIRSSIPVIKQEYLNETFLLAVASQLGLPVIGSRAKVEEYMSLLNIGTNFNKNWILIPHINLETGFVDGGTPTPVTDMEEDDPRNPLITGTNAFSEVAIADTSDIDPNHYTDSIDLNSPNLDAIGKFNRYFAISESDIDDFVNFLYTSNASTISDIMDGLKLNGENPMNFLIGLRMFPFNILNYSTTSPQTIQFGNGVDTGVIGELITKFDAVIDLGSCEFRRYYGNYLDYEPYTTAKLYIPYCNELDIPTSVFVGHTINVKLIVDITTGACCGVVFKDGIPCLYANGNIGIEIPITGENATEYVKQGLDAALKAGSAAVQIAQNGAMMGKTGLTETGGTATSGGSSLNTSSGIGNSSYSNSTHMANNWSKGNQISKSHQFSWGGIAGGVAQGLEAAYEFNYMPTALQTNGTSSPTTSLYKPQFCYFIVTSSVPLAPSGYGETIGYACMERRSLASDDGYVVIHNPACQPEHATSAETNEINQLLSTGVWV